LLHIAFLLTSLASEEEGLALAIRVVSFQDETTLVSRAAKQLSGKAWLFQLVTLSVRLLPQKKAGFRKKVKKKLAKR